MPKSSVKDVTLILKERATRYSLLSFQMLWHIGINSRTTAAILSLERSQFKNKANTRITESQRNTARAGHQTRLEALSFVFSYTSDTFT